MNWKRTPLPVPGNLQLIVPSVSIALSPVHGIIASIILYGVIYRAYEKFRAYFMSHHLEYYG